jgi:hypothetical protein
MHVVLHQKLGCVAFRVVQIDIQSQLVSKANILGIHRLSAGFQGLGKIDGHVEAVRFVEKLVSVLDAVGHPVFIVVRHCAFLVNDHHVVLVANTPPCIIAKQLSRLDKLHLNGGYLDALSQRDEYKVSLDRRSDDVVLLRYGNFVGEFRGPYILIDLQISSVVSSDNPQNAIPAP